MNAIKFHEFWAQKSLLKQALSCHVTNLKIFKVVREIGLEPTRLLIGDRT